MTNKDSLVRTSYNGAWIEQRADPYVYRHTDGTYYFTASVPAYDRIVLRRASTIKGLASAEETTVWKKHPVGLMSQHIWAPEIHYLQGKWYIYFAASKVDDIWALRPYVLECESQDPIAGPWRELGQMQCADDDPFSFRSFSLDATVFEDGGTYYYIWAEKVGVGAAISNLYIAKLETPNKLKTVQVLLTTPDYDWERVDFWVNEGPAILKHDGKIYMTFSGSGTGACYCVGMMSAQEGSDLLDPLSWKKERYPVLRTDAEKHIYGPGHNCFVKSEDGKKDLMVFHARQYEQIVGDPLYDPNRHAMILEVTYDETGRPLFEYQKTGEDGVSSI